MRSILSRYIDEFGLRSLASELALGSIFGLAFSAALWGVAVMAETFPAASTVADPATGIERCPTEAGQRRDCVR